MNAICLIVVIVVRLDGVHLIYMSPYGHGKFLGLSVGFHELVSMPYYSDILVIVEVYLKEKDKYLIKIMAFWVKISYTVLVKKARS